MDRSYNCVNPGDVASRVLLTNGPNCVLVRENNVWSLILCITINTCKILNTCTLNLTNNAIKFYYDDILDLEPFITF